MTRQQADLYKQGTLELLILRLLSSGTLNGWDMMQRIQLISGEVLTVTAGALYPALHRLEARGLISAVWKPSENNRKAKFYAITAAGKRQLAREVEASPSQVSLAWLLAKPVVSSVIFGARSVEQLDDNGIPVLGPDGQPIVAVVKDLPASERFFAGGDSTVRGFVLDLRNNPGGYLDESVSVSSQFIDKGVIVSEKKDVVNGRKMEYKATGKGKMTDSKLKIVVLINEGSASASEIVAGALQDYKRAILVGEKTFGKGSVQEIETLSGGARLRVTVAHWYTPKGKNIGKEGIKPDVEVKLTEEDYNANRDPQLSKALELLK